MRTSYAHTEKYLTTTKITALMKERTILIASLIVTILGLLFLFLYADELDLKVVENMDTIQLQEPIRIYGKVLEATTTDKVIFLKMEGERVETVDIIVFNDEDILVRPGDNVEIQGVVEEYNGKKEIIASSVVLR